MAFSGKVVGRAGLACGWALAAGMSGIGAIRLFRSESQPQLIGLQAVGMWLLIPAYPLAIAAALARKRTLAAVAIVLALGNVVWVSELYETGQQRAVPVGAAPLRLVTANILVSNTEVSALAADLLATGADVILLQEVTQAHLAELGAAGLLHAYPFHVFDPHLGSHGSAILSALPISAGRAIDVAGSPMTRADISTAAGTVRVINVHTVAPINESRARRWRAQLDALAAMPAQHTGPLIMAGDFNATADHEPMDTLLSSGMHDAFSAAGDGIGATWPQWAGPMFPVMRLDHVLVNDSISVLSAEVQANRGSDHRRVAVELAVPAGRGAAAASTRPSLYTCTERPAVTAAPGKRRNEV